MLKIIVGVFMVLHGLVHLLYLGQRQRFFELQPGLVWPDGAWAFSRLLGDVTTRKLAGVLLVLAAMGFVAGGVGILAGQDWWRLLVVGAAVLSAVLYILMWNGYLQQLDDQGIIGILINVAILAAVLVLRWPKF
ncbi:MAG: hypothetical protein JXR84_17420 [Anaerolineae bacterium]|nr:hypothetical protein [Anaerolineae bacterium]